MKQLIVTINLPDEHLLQVPDENQRYRLDNVGRMAIVEQWLKAAMKADSNSYIGLLSDQNLAEKAAHAARQDYWDDVRGVVEDVKGQIEAGDLEDEEAIREYIEQTVDGHRRVIYTAQAQEALLYSDNDGAYFDDFGAEGAVDSDGIQWSRLAYAAMLQDVYETPGDVEELLEEKREADEEKALEAEAEAEEEQALRDEVTNWEETLADYLDDTSAMGPEEIAEAKAKLAAAKEALAAWEKENSTDAN